MPPVLKPPSCAGCPLEKESTHYVPDETIEGAEVFNLGQNPGDTEEREGRPFCGDTGEVFNTVFLPLAGLERGRNVSVGNTFRCRLGKTNNVPKPTVLAAAAAHCAQHYLHIPESTKLVIAQGAVAWNFTQGRKDLSIVDWRGHIGPEKFQGLPVYGTLHLADLAPNRNPRMTLPTKMDWRKIPAIVSGARPLEIPQRLVIGQAGAGMLEMTEWFMEAETNCGNFYLDTEYIFDEDHPTDPRNYAITVFGGGYVRPDGSFSGIQMPWMDGDIPSSLKAEWVRRLYRLLGTVRLVGHNIKAEFRSMLKTWNFDPWRFAGRYEDTMQWHGVYWSEWPHDLEFCESLHSPYPKLKHLMHTNLLLYNWGDILTTWKTHEHQLKEEKTDPESVAVYRNQNLPLVLITLKRELEGIQTNKAAILPAMKLYQEKLDYATLLASAYCGWPINLGSPTQLKHWLYTVEKLAEKKHKKTRKTTVNADAIAELRATVSSFDADLEQKEGITADYVDLRIAEGANPLLESLMLYGEADQAMGHYLRPLLVERSEE